MLLLLPPSESKAAGTDGPPLDLTALSFPSLTRTRRQLLRELVRLARTEPAALQQALGLPDARRQEVQRDAQLLKAPTLPVLELYTGVVYDNLSYATLPEHGRRTADCSVVVASSLFGLLRPGDRVPSYRLSAGTVLPGLGGLAARWRPVLEKALAQEGLIVDLRSGAYANLARLPEAVQVRVLREAAGRRTVVSHDNKWTKGRLARELCLRPATTVQEVAEAGRAVSDAVEVDGNRVDLLLYGLASAR